MGIQKSSVVVLYRELHSPEVAGILAVGIRRGFCRACQGAEMKEVRMRSGDAEQVP